jgi:hypothetical protein
VRTTFHGLHVFWLIPSICISNGVRANSFAIGFVWLFWQIIVGFGEEKE